MMAPSLLLIEDDPAFSRRLLANLQASGYQARGAATASEAWEALSQDFFDLVITDIRLPDESGLSILKKIKAGEKGLDRELPVVVLTSVRDVETAVEAMRLGAADYLTKESEKAEIRVRLERALSQSALVNENRLLRAELEKQNAFGEMIGESPALKAIQEEIAQLAGQDVPVLITGETGVGKELVARALHRTGSRPDGPFVDVNCGALPDENLLLSELFGHEKGAFTGATSLKRGKFEMAQGGTFFLDEIGEMPLDAQTKVLKAIETLEVTRLGGSTPIQLQCRLLFATNKDLEKEVQDGRFRQDLFYRIHLLPIHVPPLRERREDILRIAHFFADLFARQYNKGSRSFRPEAMEMLQAASWPGNVRELRNVVERLVIRSRQESIGAEDLGRCGLVQEQAREAGFHLPPGGLALDDLEKQAVVSALEKTDWNQKEAARLLHISVDRMNNRVKKFGLTHPGWRVNR